MKVNGEKTNNTVRELNLGLIKLSMKVNMKMVKNMAREPSTGQIIQYTREASLIIIFTAKESTLGPTEGAMKATGKITRWMDMECLHGQMEGNM